MRHRLGYVPALDGLRAIAVFLVMLIHAHLKLGLNGKLGVDIFFAISGFLITTLVLEEFQSNKEFSIKAFYVRRFFRLIPLFYILIGFVLIYALFFADPDIIEPVLKEVYAAGLYLYNISWIWGWGDAILLGHTWSLAVEEQFYLLWPILLYISIRKNILKYFMFFLGVLILVSVSFKFLGYFSGLGYSLVHESLYIGCFGALMRWFDYFPKSFPSIVNVIILFIIVIVGIFPVSIYQQLFEYGGRSFFGLLTLFLIVGITINEKCIVSKFLGFPFFVFIGKISYGLYLWHLPVFRLFYWHSPFEPYQSFILKFIVSFLLAYFSWILLERRSIKIGKSISKRIIHSNG